ncbi:uncharacterized protein HMPREF1541_09529 [Cyphellophora europaea CBS 101466]|uniref:Ketoreductase (KR) domain-containing protein n=1 Tax=Cyphellophora europaea (strain CBS 101466) TaxID=1220924 RepID=W2SAD9_CYPE1|nr:uncharacterized protein HMPREF1541_09529 [Cyphellophora europaea CBS 101466]ETN45696.1 hypothetical protein HMPREF1541_09529 [Cyphellophora europaea CBS 101466]
MTTKEEIKAVLDSLRDAKVTPFTHDKPYAAILPTRPELSQAGRTILITGGGTGVGLNIGHAFVKASPDTIIILGRRADVLQSAVSALEKEAKSVGVSTRIIARPCDLTNVTEVKAFWKSLANEGITVDVLVHSAAKFTEPKPMLELGADEVWSQIEANTKAPLYFTEQFCAQSMDRRKFIVNLTSAVIHSHRHPAVAIRPAYILSKTTATLFFQLLAQAVSPEHTQIVTMEPGLVYNEYWESLGLPTEYFSNPELSADFAVWAASEEAAFLHGRMAWASWDVDELRAGELRKRIDADPYFLQVSVSGIEFRV